MPLIYWVYIYFSVQLSGKLLKQENIMERLESSFRKSYSRYWDLIKQYVVSISRKLIDILQFDQLQCFSKWSTFSSILWPWYRAWALPKCEWFQCSVWNGYGKSTGNAYPSGHLVCIRSNSLRPVFAIFLLRLWMLGKQYQFGDGCFHKNWPSLVDLVRFRLVIKVLCLCFFCKCRNVCRTTVPTLLPFLSAWNVYAHWFQ